LLSRSHLLSDHVRRWRHVYDCVRTMQTGNKQPQIGQGMLRRWGFREMDCLLVLPTLVSLPFSIISELGGDTSLDQQRHLCRDAKVDVQLTSCVLIDANSELINVHARCCYTQVEQFRFRGRFEREVPLVIRLRRSDHIVPAGAAEFDRHAAHRLFCSKDYHLTRKRAAYGNPFLHDELGRMSARRRENYSYEKQFGHSGNH
jgi:hypothetical protein